MVSKSQSRDDNQEQDMIGGSVAGQAPHGRESARRDAQGRQTGDDLEDRVDPDDEDFTGLEEVDDDIQPSPPHPQEALRWSTRPSMPSMKFLEQIAHAED